MDSTRNKRHLLGACLPWEIEAEKSLGEDIFCRFSASIVALLTQKSAKYWPSKYFYSRFFPRLAGSLY
jgi:hypothetical protein